jgi:signal transduction histidine kinase
VVAEAVEMAQESFVKHSVKCSVEGPATLPIEADALLLSQALLNLVMNAAEAIGEHGMDSGSIDLRFGVATPESGARQAWIIIRDSGPGIPLAALDKIFNPFFTTKGTGTGLGLAIVQRIIEAHDGSISATNVEGGGAHFEVRL